MVLLVVLLGKCMLMPCVLMEPHADGVLMLCRWHSALGTADVVPLACC